MMKLARHFATCAIMIGLLAAVPPATAQETGGVSSLGELARQMRAERNKEKQEPVVVFTNDNLPSESSMGIKDHKSESDKKSPAEDTSQPSPGAEEHGEKYFRSKADKIHSRLEFHRRQLDVLQQQLGLAKMQYYPDPQKTLEQESTPSFQSDVDKLRAKIEATQKAIDDDQKALDDLQEELRREGGDPGWIR